MFPLFPPKRCTSVMRFSGDFLNTSSSQLLLVSKFSKILILIPLLCGTRAKAWLFFRYSGIPKTFVIVSWNTLKIVPRFDWTVTTNGRLCAQRLAGNYYRASCQKIRNLSLQIEPVIEVSVKGVRYSSFSLLPASTNDILQPCVKLYKSKICSTSAENYNVFIALLTAGKSTSGWENDFFSGLLL